MHGDNFHNLNGKNLVGLNILISISAVLGYSGETWCSNFPLIRL